jgi:hypothetical protein
VIETAVAVIVAVIASGVALYFFGLDRDYEVASLVIRSADFLVTPFRSIFLLDNNYYQVALNWGSAQSPISWRRSCCPQGSERWAARRKRRRPADLARSSA